MRNILLFLLSLCLGCNNIEKSEIEKWVGRRIIFPEHIPSYSSDKDNEVVNKPQFTVVMYVDSVGCSSCKSNMVLWKALIEKHKNSFGDKFGYKLYFQSNDIKDMLEVNDFPFNVYLDSLGIIQKLNDFPTNDSFRCFLVDSLNRVVIVGNPINNPKIWMLYDKVLSSEMKKCSLLTQNKIITQVVVDKDVIRIDKLKKDVTSKVDVIVKNIGENPLVIYDVISTCGCTSIKWDKRNIKAKNETKLEISVTPNESGEFSKLIYIYCNTSTEYIYIRLLGDVE